MKRPGRLCLIVPLLGCMAAEPLPADREACVAAGLQPGTEAFETCLQERLASRFARTPGAEIDELRTLTMPRPWTL